MPSLKSRGADIGFADFALDMAFGAALGGLLGGGGGYFGARAKAREDARLAEQEARRLASLPGFDATPDSFFAAMEKQTHIPALPDFDATPDDFLLPNEYARRNIHGEARQTLLNAFEASIGDVVDGRAVDVGQVGGIRESIGKAYDAVLRDPTGGPADEVLAVLRSPEFERVLLERGPSFFDKESGELIVRGRDIARMGYDASGFGMVKIIWRHGEKSNVDSRFQVTREDVMRLPEILENFEPRETGKKGQGRIWSVPNENGTMLAVVVNKRKGSEQPTTITVFRTDDAGRYAISVKRKAPASFGRRAPFPAKRTPEDTPAGIFDHAMPEEISGRQGQGLDETVSPVEAEVKQLWVIANKALAEEDRLFQMLSEAEARHDKAGARGTADAEYEINLARGAYLTARATSLKAVEQANLGMSRNPDLDVGRVDPFAKETPEVFTPAPERSQEQRTVLEEIGYDETGKTTPEESETMRLVEAGAAPREEGLALMEAQDAETMRKNIEDAGYSIMGCVMEVIE
jgi:hypothetical protein